MMSGIDLEVIGALETQREMERVITDLHGRPMMQAMREAALVVEGDAKRNAPVDTGRLRASIASEVRTVGGGVPTVLGVVGSNVVYAPWMEYGTGTFAGQQRHYPPPVELAQWALRKGLDAHQVAHSIFMAGGLKPRRYLQRAFESNRGRIVRIIGRGVEGIVR